MNIWSRPTSDFAKAALTLLALAFLVACRPAGGTSPPGDDERWTEMRETLVEAVASQTRDPQITDQRVLDALRAVERHRFVPDNQRARAYEDRPLPIGHGVTISQPYVVALMTQLAQVTSGQRVLEIGTGSGYQAAILAELGVTVYTIEIIEAHAELSAALLTELGYDGRIHVRLGDGWLGWPDEAPFDAIVVTAAPEHVPPVLIEQLAVGGRIVAPVGPQSTGQRLIVGTKLEDGSLDEEFVAGVRFVPMTGGEVQP